MEKPNETLFLVLKKQWYDMIDSGEKTEEYRYYSWHWKARIGDQSERINRVVFQDGYVKNARRMGFEVAGIYDLFLCGGEHCLLTNVEGDVELELNPDWGYDPMAARFYVIKLGKRRE